MFGNKIQGYRNSKRMAVNGMVERLCKEEDVGYMDLRDSCVGNEDIFAADVCLCSEVLQPGGSWSSPGSGSM